MKILHILCAILCLNASVNALLVVNEPAVIVYETPEENGLIEDIIRYGTIVDVSTEQDVWAYITYPGWHGWILKTKLLEIEEDPEVAANAIVGFRGAYVFNMADTDRGPFLCLPFETPLKIIQELPEAHRRWVIVQLQNGQRGYMQRSQLQLSKMKLTLPEAVAFSQQFIGTKYLWGGTTSFGYDCSGFVQMIYRQMGITLPRNSNQQAVDPRFTEIKAGTAKAGDLVFFKNGSGRVVHVGMMINANEFIHAFTKEESWICISALADERFRNGYFYFGTVVKRLTPS